MKYLSLVLLFVLAALAVEAQEATTAKTPVVTTAVRVPLSPRAPMEIIAGGATKTVKGAPFSAEAVSESVQTLADGNRITRSYTTKMFRDSEGRFRREGSPDAGGSGSGYVASGGLVSIYGFGDMISIFDPVEGVRYSLDAKNKTARRVPFRPFGVSVGVGTTVTVNGQTAVTPAVPLTKAQIEAGTRQAATLLRQAQVYTQIAPVTSVGAVTVVSAMSPDAKYETKTESLGNRSVDGVDSEGTRTTTTIPAGAIGNERPIEIVYERWYSKDLQLIVFSKHYDPRFGEQTYRLSNISRSEPERSLFTPPSDYKLINEPPISVYTTKPQQ